MRFRRIIFSALLSIAVLPALAGDRGIVWDAVLGGSGADGGRAIAIDGWGNVYVAGRAGAAWGSPVRSFGVGDDAFVAKLDPDGSLLWLTFLGGAGDDAATGIAVDSSGNVFITGTSDASWGSPLRSFGVIAGNTDVFTAKLNASGTLLWHTFLGFGQSGVSAGIAMDGSGNPIIAGYCSLGGASIDAFASKLNASGLYLWLTFLGGTGRDYGTGVAADASGSVFVAGTSETSWGSPRRAFGASTDGFAAKLSSSGTTQWNTFLGGSGADAGSGIAVDDAGNVYVSGDSDASWGSPLRAFGAATDGFAAKLNSSGTLQWSAFLGGSGEDRAAGIAVDGAGNSWIAGPSGAAWGSPFHPFTTARDTFAVRLNTAGTILWSTFYGGTGTSDDAGAAVAGDGAGNACVAGSRWSAGAVADAFAFKLHSNALALTSPNGGEAWTSGTDRDILWATAGTVAKVRLEYSRNSGTSWTSIISSTTNTGSFKWTAPAIAATTCLVRVKEATTGIPSDTSDAVFSIGPARPVIALSRTAVSFGAPLGGPAAADQSVVITNANGGTLGWKATPSASWITASPASGTGGATVSIGVKPAGLSAGTHTGSVSVSDPDAANSPQSVAVSLRIYAAGLMSGPFGEFSTPAGGTTGIAGAIPVTGWALDDIGVTKLEIKRDQAGGDPAGAVGPDGLVFIGDAVFIEGARPDVETDYPSYPMSYKAGWGYMLLTNFLPGQGNGTFKLYAIATDVEGNATTLGTKTITCSNATATKPFGTIDTPAQGGDASGNPYLNFGWVLTPLPKTVPKNGSTIQVYVDSVQVGALNAAPNIFNQYRVDVSTSFPGLNNSGGPVGAYYLDTTKYANGVHTIHWVAYDDAGQGDGIGSRYFNIVNTGGSPEPTPALGTPAPSISDLSRLPISFKPLRVKAGYDRDAEFQPRLPGSDGILRIEIPEVGRVEIELGNTPESAAFMPGRTRFSGYLLVGDAPRPLPVGSTLDRRTGRFSWMPGPGFVGTYDLLILKDDGNGAAAKVPLRIVIRPKS
jgi:hypothetical protein